MLEWWQHIPEQFDPVAFILGPVALYWYGIFYIIGWATAFAVYLYFSRRKPEEWPAALDFFLWLFIGALLGGKAGYILFYNFPFFLAHPEALLPYDLHTRVWTGLSGMSYHGALIGVIFAALYALRQKRAGFWQEMDLLALAAPWAAFFGRIGNFLNGELYGRVTERPWGMFFPRASSPYELRHPSELYEALGEGIVLFLFLSIFMRFTKRPGMLSAAYLTAYGALRFSAEWFREPDPQIGLLSGLSIGQWFSGAMIAAGIVASWWLGRKKYAIIGRN